LGKFSTNIVGYAPTIASDGAKYQRRTLEVSFGTGRGWGVPPYFKESI